MADQRADQLNYSNAFNSKSLLVLDNDRKLSEFWLKDVSIPNISVPELISENEPHSLKFEGNVIEFGTLAMTIHLDENFTVYEELYNWLTQGLPPADAVPNSSATRPFIDGTVMILNNTLTTPLVKFNFKNMFITEIPGLEYNNYGSDPLSLAVSIQFDRMTPVFLST